MTTISSTSTALLQSLTNLKDKLTAADTDASGSLSVAEFTAASKIDPNLTAGPNGSISAAAEFKKLDSDGDGKLTTAELTSGINLATQVQSVLLQGQEIASGSAFMALLNSSSGSSSSSSSLFGSSTDFSSLTSSLLGGGSSSSTLASILSGGNANTSELSQLFGGSDTSSNDTYTALLQQLIDKYSTATPPATTTPTDTTA